ncbi:MAG TPA: thiol:disulfide interchange protein DsbA/DsbL [Aquabacterium sp.]|uniref:thiol:disulfide interchange protein DsbA/DsbL n=1 Tax=Aquabacterium sp. TaxID=1872578 RepID=UPI002E37C4E3|nr:thiol:disulfide interchange protein DsbA/DsbL [Aquabacterium sp.]HEX5357400.1 thiol:disulfide interchange protein DsbA/DsbL [Aquabacterium sp.]
MSLLRKALLCLAVLLLGACAATKSNVRALDVEGDGHVDLSTARSSVPMGGPHIEVFFFYTCPHCYTFYNEQLQAWAEKNNSRVSVIYTPVVWRDDFRSMAQAYYAGEMAHINPAFHTAVFDALHQNPRQERTAGFFADIAQACCKVSRAQFLARYESDAVQRAVESGKLRANLHRIDGTPMVIVNGRYLVSPSTAKNKARMMNLVDDLLTKPLR